MSSSSESLPPPLVSRGGEYSTDTINGYKALQGHYGITVTNNGDAVAPVVATTASKRFAATKDLHATKARLGDAQDLLNEYADTILDNNASYTAKKRVANDIKKSIVPFLGVAQDRIRKAAIQTANMSSMNQLHQRQDTALKQRIISKNSKKRPALQMIDSFSREEVASKTKKPPATVSVSPPATVSPPHWLHAQQDQDQASIKRLRSSHWQMNHHVPKMGIHIRQPSLSNLQLQLMRRIKRSRLS